MRNASTDQGKRSDTKLVSSFATTNCAIHLRYWQPRKYLLPEIQHTPANGNDPHSHGIPPCRQSFSLRPAGEMHQFRYGVKMADQRPPKPLCEGQVAERLGAPGIVGAPLRRWQRMESVDDCTPGAAAPWSRKM
eukprot:gnl/TRDRNA2_/TRDRNA2_122780_c1_seq2.p1 gnl/TRDRNA2_/TRDRNA2_122780_c1~~gnl/TRDRNA2_/TRDRNA2_122780_c1_seq2.p1  ORF type:complete len:134 (-),score=3.49 gnl/TRDRNA2_/TRDRNA2_122780_c1_seq2:35-436(-)